MNIFYRNSTHEDCSSVQYPLRQWTTIQQCVHTEFVPRICRLGLSASRSFRTIFRKLSTNRLILWQWQAISSWSRASIAIHTYLKRQTHTEYRQEEQEKEKCVHYKSQDGYIRSGLLWSSVPITVSSYITRQSLRQVRPNPIQFLWSWQGIKSQLLHVGLYQPILQTTHIHTYTHTHKQR